MEIMIKMENRWYVTTISSILYMLHSLLVYKVFCCHILFQKYGEDRLFTTSMAINALITTWTYYNDVTGHLHWDESRHFPFYNTGLHKF